MQRLPNETAAEFQQRRLRERVATRIEEAQTFEELREALAGYVRNNVVPVRVAPPWERNRG